MHYAALRRRKQRALTRAESAPYNQYQCGTQQEANESIAETNVGRRVDRTRQSRIENSFRAERQGADDASERSDDR
jgi:hypothetical protein